MSEDNIDTLFKGLEGAVKAAMTLDYATENIPGFAEFFARKHKSWESMGARFESGIIDLILNHDNAAVLCVVRYFNSLDSNDTITALLFRDGREYPSRENYQCRSVDECYGGMKYVGFHDNASSKDIAELSILLDGKLRGVKISKE